MAMLRRLVLAVPVLAVLGAAAQAAAADWPAFRGPQGNGIASEEPFPTVWGPKQNVKWKAELPATGNGSPIVASGQVFVAGAHDRGAIRSLYCFGRAGGRLLWVRSVNFRPGEETHGTNPYCGSTPAADGERVVVWHGSAGLFCYDYDGDELWSNDLGDVEHEWGYGSSPVIHRDRVLLNFGPGEQTFMAAVDLKTGELKWKTDEPGGNNTRKPKMVGSWSTPSVVELDTEKYDPVASNHLNEPTNATPAFSDGEVFVRTRGYLYCIAETGDEAAK